MSNTDPTPPTCPGCVLAHDPDDCPALPLVAEARAFVAGVGAGWTFASTMAENPHWYVVLHRQQGRDRDGFEALRALIRRHGWKRRWGGSTWRTYTLDGFDYWFIHPVINRKPTASAGWDDPDKGQGRLF